MSPNVNGRGSKNVTPDSSDKRKSSNKLRLKLNKSHLFNSSDEENHVNSEAATIVNSQIPSSQIVDKVDSTVEDVSIIESDLHISDDESPRINTKTTSTSQTETAPLNADGQQDQDLSQMCRLLAVNPQFLQLLNLSANISQSQGPNLSQNGSGENSTQMER
uniref:Uncharacterized protein n=1 Tax=Trichogramma kaykai TaxID=54128 RepID=A0ABD2W717_9HYME